MKLSFVSFLLFSVVYCQNFYISNLRDVPKRLRERFSGRRNRRPFQTPFLPNIAGTTEEERPELFRPQSFEWPPETASRPTTVTGGNQKECFCGKENVPLSTPVKLRIVGGHEVEPRNRYPWMALITDKNESLCGGAVINDRYVVTAAHCIDVCEESIEDCKVVLGVHKVDDSRANIYDVEKLIKHDEYRLFLNDIGLIKLKGKIKFSNYVRPICLPEQLQPKDIKPYEQSIMTAGWGLTANGKASDVLMQFEAKDWLTNDKSKSRFCKDLLCLKPGQGRFESGDSGGPAWITVNNRSVIVGIVSHYRLHRMRLTRVPLVRQWIESNTESAHYCH